MLFTPRFAKVYSDRLAVRTHGFRSLHSSISNSLQQVRSNSSSSKSFRHVVRAKHAPSSNIFPVANTHQARTSSL
ncbi:hypothetical protein RRG08_067203 [Elysia crispata]|uniref:Uncharacterized protein n=1 Tax=Elysia crispata TaxID=231223 RepID=A0AAE1CVH8_9GAST|nr:hypothetical protein RRG08_067203 [Elysia crispata]